MDKVLHVLAEPRRREILRLIWQGEKCAGDIAAALPISFAAVSQHLAQLKRVGAVEQRKQGRQRMYRVRKDALGPLARALESMWSDQLARLRELAEEEEKHTHARKKRRSARKK